MSTAVVKIYIFNVKVRQVITSQMETKGTDNFFFLPFPFLLLILVETKRSIAKEECSFVRSFIVDMVNCGPFSRRHN